MVLRSFLSVLILFTTSSAFAQPRQDSIFLYRKTVVGTVKEIRGREIVYQHPTEALLYYVPKSIVVKIIFANGRSEEFNDPKSFNKVKSSDDWKSVEIVTTAYETEGMVKLADMISVKATGATVYSSVTNTQNRAFRKLQMAAALLGGDVIRVLNVSTEGNIINARATRTQLTASVYRSVALDTTGLLTVIKGKNLLGSVQKELSVNSAKIAYVFFNHAIRINPAGLEIRNGIVFVKPINPEKIGRVDEYMLTYWDKNTVILAYRWKNRFYEMVFKHQ